MKLDDLMIRAYMEGFSGASIYCDEEKREEVITYLEDGCNQIGEFIHTIDETEYGARVYLPMDNVFGVEEFDCKSILNRFEELLKKMKLEKPYVEYRAYFACRFDDETNDTASCEIYNYELTSNKEMESNEDPYDFVGFALKFAAQEGGSMWGELSELFEEINPELDDIERIADCLKLYVDAGMLDDVAYGEFLNIVSDYDDDLSMQLAEILMC